MIFRQAVRVPSSCPFQIIGLLFGSVAHRTANARSPPPYFAFSGVFSR